jgi:FkbM family methyltransferase
MRVPGINAARAAAVARRLAARASTRRVLNAMYGPLTWEQKQRLHARFATIFRDDDGPFEPGEWRVDFAGRTVRVPLSETRTWLAWDAALALLGHETEIKRTYDTLVRLERPPTLVLDVGANYGTHSILLLAHGVTAISFEPNRNCHQFFRNLCAANGVPCRLEPVAVGAEEGTVDLWFPETHEWLGTTDPATRDALQAQAALSRQEVRRTTVDRYVAEHGLHPHLIKIDTEGSDLQVLQGSAATLRRDRPLIVFESWQADRKQAADLLAGHGYQVCRLPLGPGGPAPLPSAEFLQTDAANFLAVPEEVVGHWPPAFR